MCLCDSPSPTTIIDDLDQLLTNKNLQTAFGSQGLSNLENWTNFYLFGTFWTLLSQTIVFVVLYKKGKMLDSLDALKFQHSSSKIYPTSSCVKIEEPHNA